MRSLEKKGKDCKLKIPEYKLSDDEIIRAVNHENLMAWSLSLIIQLANKIYS